MREERLTRAREERLVRAREERLVRAREERLVRTREERLVRVSLLSCLFSKLVSQYSCNQRIKFVFVILDIG